MTTQTVYGHLVGPTAGARFKGTATDGTELSISTDQTPALSAGDWAGVAGTVITHAVVTADTVCDYAYIRSRAGLTKGVIPVGTTGRIQSLPLLPIPIRLEVGDVLRVKTTA